MTREEIKEHYSMLDILDKCGVKQPNKQGFINCPFHKEKTGSMKISNNVYYCFGCGARGDIFSFIQEYYNCDFRTAFQMLGGTYDKPNFKTDLAIYKAKKAKAMKLKKEQKLNDEKQLNKLLISVYRKWIKKFEPYSDEWCDCINKLEYQIGLYEELNNFNS